MSKLRVESCLTIGPPLDRLRNSNVVWYWDRFDSRVYYSIYAPSRTLGLVFNHGLPVEQEIHLERTIPHYGGIRWWFICTECGARVARLHKPPLENYFWCRRCHDLTYESAQTSHTRVERFFKNAAREFGTTTREARLTIRRDYAPQSVAYEVKRPVMTGKF